VATAVRTITVVVDTAMVVNTRAIGSEMAAGTVWLVGGRWPDYDLRVVRMAIRTREVGPVIQRLISQANMLIDVRDPCVGGVAIVTFACCDEVSRILAGRRIAVMAGTAGTENLCVINRCYGYPCNRRMAVLTNVGGQDMCRMLAGGIGAVMAADAVIGDVGVIEVGRCRMAIITVVATGDMRRVLALGRVAIVAREAGADDLRVIDHVCRRKRHNIVTVFANHGRIDVSRVFADGLYPVMTT